MSVGIKKIADDFKAVSFINGKIFVDEIFDVTNIKEVVENIIKRNVENIKTFHVDITEEEFLHKVVNENIEGSYFYIEDNDNCYFVTNLKEDI